MDLNNHLLLWWLSRSWSSCVSTGELCADLSCVFPILLGSAGWPELALLRLKSLSRNMKDFLMPDLELAHNCFYPLPLAEAGPTSQAKVKTIWPEVLAQRNGLLGPVSQSTMKTKLLTIVISQEKILHDYFMHLFIKYWLVVGLVSKLMSYSCKPMDCSLLDSSVHGISQARRLESVVISFSRGSSWPKDWTHVSCTAGRFFTAEPPVKPKYWLTFTMYQALFLALDHEQWTKPPPNKHLSLVELIF